MSIDELIEALTIARAQLGGNKQVVRYDDGNHRLLNVVRIESTSVQTAVIEDLTGLAGWTLNADRPGEQVRACS
jgi:hypothetical protein